MNAIRRLTAIAINRMIQRYVDDEHTVVKGTIHRANEKEFCGHCFALPQNCICEANNE